MKKFVKKTLSIALALVMCAGMVAPAFAASFADLQDAINGNGGTEFKHTAEDGTESTRYGYSENKDDEGKHVSWGIEAWDEGDTRNVQLNEDVRYGGTDSAPSPSKDLGTISISNAKVNLDLNGKTLDGGYRPEIKNEQGEVTQQASKGSTQPVIYVEKNAVVTLSNGTVTGGNNTWYNWKRGGGIASVSSTLTINNVDVTGNKVNNYGGGIHVIDSTLNMTGGSISNNTAGADGGGLYAKNSTVNMTSVTISENNGGAYAGGIESYGAKMNLVDVDITGNYGRQFGGGIITFGGSHIVMEKGSIVGNYATGKDVGGGMAILEGTDKIELSDVLVTGNRTGGNGGGIYVAPKASLILHNGNEIHDNFDQYDYQTESGRASDIYAKANAKVEGLGTASKAPTGKQFDGWYENDADNGQSESKYEYAEGSDNSTIIETVNLVAGLSDAPEEPTPEVPSDDSGNSDVTIPDENVPMGETPDDVTDETDDPTVEIDDPAVPLASGPVTRAQFIDYLWRHEGEPASGGVCTFTDVPEDHIYVLALAWAEQNEVAFPYEDGTFEPDELITVGAAREFLSNFETVFGRQAVAASALKSLTGADDEAVLNCGEVLAEFFGE